MINTMYFNCQVLGWFVVLLHELYKPALDVNNRSVDSSRVESSRVESSRLVGQLVESVSQVSWSSQLVKSVSQVKSSLVLSLQ